MENNTDILSKAIEEATPVETVQEPVALTAENAIMNTMPMPTTSIETADEESVEVNDAALSAALGNGNINFQMPRKTGQLVRNYRKIGNNETCPCGSGKKYKKCCKNTGKYDGYTEYGTQKDPYTSAPEDTAA